MPWRVHLRTTKPRSTNISQILTNIGRMNIILNRNVQTSLRWVWPQIVKHGKHISLVICVPPSGKHISLVICVPLPGKLVFLVMCSLTWETCIPSDMCSLPGKHISLVIRVPAFVIEPFVLWFAFNFAASRFQSGFFACFHQSFTY